MTTFRVTLFALLALLLLCPSTQTSLLACDQPPGYGFWIDYSVAVYVDGTFQMRAGQPGTVLRATFDDYDPPYAPEPGSTGPTNRTTTGTPTTPWSLGDFRGLATPAFWTIHALSGPCSLPGSADLVTYHRFGASSVPVDIECQILIYGSMGITPNPYQWDGLGSLHITSANFSGAYGNPLLEVYYLDEYSNGSQTYSGIVSLNGDGSIDWSPPAGVFEFGSGTYEIIVYDAEPGYYAAADAGDLYTYS